MTIDLKPDWKALAPENWWGACSEADNTVFLSGRLRAFSGELLSGRMLDALAGADPTDLMEWIGSSPYGPKWRSLRYAQKVRSPLNDALMLHMGERLDGLARKARGQAAQTVLLLCLLSDLDAGMHWLEHRSAGLSYRSLGAFGPCNDFFWEELPGAGKRSGEILWPVEAALIHALSTDGPLWCRQRAYAQVLIGWGFEVLKVRKICAPLGALLIWLADEVNFRLWRVRQLTGDRPQALSFSTPLAERVAVAQTVRSLVAGTIYAHDLPDERGDGGLRLRRGTLIRLSKAGVFDPLGGGYIGSVFARALLERMFLQQVCARARGEKYNGTL